ncbi:MAG: hypothetical protein GDA52_02900 [Rhodobacteraceae bacterium]|nr:hypothetical protein [Paracoccaceae bacterium]
MFRNSCLMSLVLIAQSAAAWGADETLCEVYANTYDGANQTMASIEAGGIFDDSAPRETMRQLQMLNERLLQLLLMQQMEYHGCDLPKIPSGAIGYMVDAMKCANERLLGNGESPECDREEW